MDKTYYPPAILSYTLNLEILYLSSYSLEVATVSQESQILINIVFKLLISKIPYITVRNCSLRYLMS